MAIVVLYTNLPREGVEDKESHETPMFVHFLVNGNKDSGL